MLLLCQLDRSWNSQNSKTISKSFCFAWEYHYLPYHQTPTEGRSVDDWQPRVQLKEAFSREEVSSSEPESISTFSDKFIAKPKYVLADENGGKCKEG